MDVSKEFYSKIKSFAADLGFPAISAAVAAPVMRAHAIEDWVHNGFHAGMSWYPASLEKRLNPKKAFEKAKTVLVLLSPYNPEPSTLGPWKLARYASGDDYHDLLKKRLKQLCRFIKEEIPESDFRVYVDSGPIAERYWAEQAGLGWIGKNGMLIHKKNGSYFFISCILTDLTFPVGTPHTFHCGSCTLCLDQCPTKAIVRPGTVDANKCISYQTIEHRGDFVEKPNLQGWVFGCDICQEVCPWNKKLPDWSLLEIFKPRDIYATLTNKELQRLDDQTFRSIFRKSPIKRTKHDGLKRNLIHLAEEDT